MRRINAWNYLPEEARSSTSVSAFTKESVYLQLNKIYIRFITVLLIIQDMCQCFRCDSLYVPGTCCTRCLYFIFYVKIVYVVLCK